MSAARTTCVGNVLTYRKYVDSVICRRLYREQHYDNIAMAAPQDRNHKGTLGWLPSGVELILRVQLLFTRQHADGKRFMLRSCE